MGHESFVNNDGIVNSGVRERDIILGLDLKFGASLSRCSCTSSPVDDTYSCSQLE